MLWAIGVANTAGRQHERDSATWYIVLSRLQWAQTLLSILPVPGIIIYTFIVETFVFTPRACQAASRVSLKHPARNERNGSRIQESPWLCGIKSYSAKAVSFKAGIPRESWFEYSFINQLKWNSKQELYLTALIISMLCFYNWYWLTSNLCLERCPKNNPVFAHKSLLNI